ncbi:unnamed protein product [Rotaria sordida]|uniref:SCP domain-containing protein n=1 Tax=Rotaria sordida TaxID=392033 RepID=A0A820BWM9_9BILA|nr:unnamed protein product [Rotaria sordida]CAF4199374.1 unnamed protein product [Rotaria sordida]
MEHSKSGYGENLYMMSSSVPLTGTHGRDATQSWYDEIKDYNYNKPGFKKGIGHFTQVVWNGSTHLGVGIAFGNHGCNAFVVANYSPPGNYQGQFHENVLQPSH